MSDVPKDHQQLKTDFLNALESSKDLDAVEGLRVHYFGKKGALTGLMRTLGNLSPEERRAQGQSLNVLKTELIGALQTKRDTLEQAAMYAQLAGEAIDVTLPTRPELTGLYHPLTKVTDELVMWFASQGYHVAEGPDVEDDFHNFTALNFPEDHPARQEHDTFYFAPKDDGTQKLLRTHTSPVQIREMLSKKPPIMLIAPGRTYRCDYDATHSPNFHQIEGLVIDKGVHMGHLKGTLMDFCRAFFDLEDISLRFRASYFPFTEPSAEVDIRCKRSKDHIKIGEGDDWLEILGCGMVHPNVIKNCGLDPEVYQGFAFGMGIDRIAMLKYGIPDLRPFYEPDSRWLKHYGFSLLDIPSVFRHPVS